MAKVKEELVSSNKESETSKALKTSAKQELTTNQELQTQNDLLNESFDYIEAVLATIHEPMLVLDKNLRVKSANKTFYKTFNVKEENTEGILLYDLGNGQWNIPQLRELLEDLLPKNTHFHGFEITHIFPLIGEKTMLLNARRIIQKINHEELILLAISDVTEQTNARREIEDSEKRYNLMLMRSPFGFAVLKGKNMVITLANDSIKEIWGKGKDVEGKPLFDALPELKDTAFPSLLGNVYSTGVPYQGNDLLAPLVRNGKLEDAYFNLVYQPYLEADESISGVTVIAYEVTAEVVVKQALAAQKEAEKKALTLVEETNKRYYSMLMESPFAFSILKGKDMVITLANDLIKEFWGKGKDVEGKTLLEVLPELKDQPFPDMIGKVYTTGVPVYANEILGKLTYNGQLKHKYFNVVFQPYYEADNSISGVTQIAYEVTEMVLARKKIEESDKRYNMMLMHSPFTFVVLKGKDLVVAFANDRVKAVWGKGNDVEGKSLLEIMPELNDTPFPALMDEVIATGIPYHGREVQSPQNVHGHAREEYFNFVFQPYLEADETVSGITIIGYDVTEQVIAKRKTEESEERFSNLIYTSPSAIGILLGEDLVITTANEPIIEIWGKGKEIIGKKYFEALPELAEQGYKEVLIQVYKTGIPFNSIETPVSILQNGVTTLKYYNFILYPQKNIDGEINGIGIIASEVTSQAKYNLELKASEERFRLLAMQAPVAIGVIRGEKYVVEIANAKILEIWGRTEAQVLDKPIFEVLIELNDQGFEALVDNVYTTGERFVTSELPITLVRNGQLENAYVTFVYEPLFEVDGTISGIMVLAHEITDLVVARKKIEEQVIMHENMLMNAPYMICTLEGPNHVFSFVNEQYQQLFGSRILKGKPFLEALPEFEGQGFDTILDKIYNTGEPFIGNDVPATFPREEGHTPELRYFNFSYQPMFDENRKIYSILGFGYEVTKVVKAKLMIEESEKRFRNLVEKSPYPISIFKGKELKMVVANEPILKIFHVGEEALGTPLLEIVPEMAEQPFTALLLDVFENGTTHYGNEQPAYFLRENGEKETRYFNFVYQPYHENDGTVSGVMSLATDVTEQVLARKKVEASEFRYHEMIYSSPSMIAIFKGEDMIIEIANDSIMESWGKGKDIIGKSLLSIMPEIVEQGFDKVLFDVYKTGVPFYAYEAPINLIRNGELELLHYTFFYQAQRNINGEIEGVAVIANEVSPQALLNNNLKESEERFRSLADNVPMHIFIVEPNAEANISYFNKYWLNYTGQTIEEALGRAWDGIIHPDDVQPIMDAYVPAFEKQQAYTVSAVRIKRSDGAYRWFQVYANPRYLPNGEFIGYIGVGFDIHEQKIAQDALKLSEEHFRLMADLMPAKISNASAAGDVTYFNKHWLDFSGYTFEELKDFGYHKIMHPDEVEEFTQLFKKAAETGTDLAMEMRFKNKQGEYIWHLNIASPIKDENGALKMWIGVTTEMQHQIAQREVLEHAVAQRTVELSEVNEELLRMNKELEAFNYVSSHDLQEPLRKIRTIAGRILEKENQNLSDIGKKYFLFMQNSAERMQTLIQDLLSFSRLSITDRKFETTDLTIIIEDIKKEFNDAIVEKNAVIEVKEICDVMVIPFQFRQLLHNLISNALKFSNPKTPPHIIISSVNITYSEINIANLTPHKEYCHISISDNGIGFEKEYAEKIFQVFQKLHSMEEYAGTGIGLAIVKKIVDNHRGIVTAKSSLNNGATFDIYIPT